MPKKKDKVDGYSSDDQKKVRSAIRLVWQRSYSRSLVKKRCQALDDKEYSICELCFNRVPKIYVDHIEAVGDILDGGLERLFVSSDKMQGLCKKCHADKTKSDNKKTKLKKS